LYEDEHTRVEARDSQLILTALEPDGWSGWTLSWPQFQDAYIEATTRSGACSGLDRHGLVFRAEGSDQAYLYGLSCDGRFSLRKWDGEGFIVLLDWVPDERIQIGEGAVNRLGIMLQGERMTMYINGNLLGEIRDDTYQEGTLGLFIASLNTEGYRVLVDEIAYWDNP
jgi:hypothetical protein